MNENFSNQNIQNLVDELKRRPIATEFLTPASKSGYICICGNGEGEDGTGATLNDDGTRLLCGKCGKGYSNIDFFAKHLNKSTTGKDFIEIVKFGCDYFGITFDNTFADETSQTKIKKVAQTKKVEEPFERLTESQNNLLSFVEKQGGAWRGLSLHVLQKYLNAGFLPDIYFTKVKKKLPCVVIPHDKGGVHCRALVADKVHRNYSHTATTTIFLPNTDTFDLIITEGSINAASIIQAWLSVYDKEPNFGIIATGGTSGNKNVLARLQELKDSGKNTRALIAYDNDSNNSGQNAAADLLKMLLKASFTACTVDITKQADIDLNDVLRGENGAAILADMVNDTIANAIFENPVTDNTPAKTDSKFSEIENLKIELQAVEKQLSDFDAEKNLAIESLKDLETFDRDTLFADNVLTAAAFAKIFNRQIFSELKNAIQRFKKNHAENGVALPDFNAAVNEFEKSIRTRKKDLDATRTQIKAKIQTLEFIADNKSLKNLNIPQNFTITEEGVGKIEGDHIRTFCARPVYIKYNLQNLDEGTFKQVLAFEDINHRQHTIKPLPLNIIRNKNRLIEVSEYKFPVDSGNAQSLVEFLHCLQNENENNLETIFTINNCGWYEHNDKKYFVDPRRNIEIEHEGTKGKLTVDADKCTMANSLTSKGSIDEWRKAYLLAKPSTIARATVAAAFAAPLLDLLGERNFVVYIHGKTRGGKSTAQSLAASAFGKTSDLIITFDGSIIGLNSAAAERNHYPFFIDEQQSATPAMKQDLQRWLYNDANGNERQRANKDGTARNIRKWRHVAICNGEVTISKDNWTGGAHTRLLQIAAPDVILKPDTAKQIQDIIKNNYGVAFNLFLDTILQTPIEEIQEMIDTKFKDLQGVYKDAIPEHCRYISLLRAADYFLNKALGIENCATLRTEELFDALPTADEIDDATREFNAITSFIAEKSAHFEGDLKEGVDCYGRSHIDDDYTFLTAKALKLICKESEIDYSKVIKDCVAKGYFVPSDKIKSGYKNPLPTVQKKIKGKNIDCFRIPNRFIFGENER